MGRVKGKRKEKMKGNERGFGYGIELEDRVATDIFGFIYCLTEPFVLINKGTPKYAVTHRCTPKSSCTLR